LKKIFGYFYAKRQESEQEGSEIKSKNKLMNEEGEGFIHDVSLEILLERVKGENNAEAINQKSFFFVRRRPVIFVKSFDKTIFLLLREWEKLRKVEKNCLRKTKTVLLVAQKKILKKILSKTYF
jgi:hypothetical protein